MPATVTPTPASNSSLVQRSEDATTNIFGQLTAVNVTSSVATTNLTNMFGVPILSKTTYSNAGIVTTTYASSTPGQYVISRVVFSTPVIVTNVTQYGQITPSNTTVFNTFGTPSSLLLTPGQSDVISRVAVVVADTEA